MRNESTVRGPAHADHFDNHVIPPVIPPLSPFAPPAQTDFHKALGLTSVIIEPGECEDDRVHAPPHSLPIVQLTIS